MSGRFVHLHVHTQYSLLEGAIKIPQLVKRVKELGMPACAITDHGHMFGVVDFFFAAKAAEFKPIIGAEIFYTTDSRLNKGAGGKTKRLTQTAEEDEATRNYRLVLLCKDALGYRNLCELITRGYSEGLHNGKPRVDRELLEKLSGGLIALTGGLKGEVAFHAAQGRLEKAEAAVSWLKERFRDDLYLEVQENNLPAQHRANSVITELGQRHSLPLVATADAHYLTPSAGPAQEVLMCIGAGRNIDDNRGVRLATDEFWFKDEETMLKQFAWKPEAVTNTVDVAAKCNFSFKVKDDKGKPIYHLPDFRPDNIDPADTSFSTIEHLKTLARKGLEERLATMERKGQKPDREAYKKRLEEELDMIVRTGFPGYFLVVADFINFAKSNGIPVGPGRGSGAGSLVAYSIRITDIDPIPFNLLFERFINPERISMPDFDVDFCQDRRHEVIAYVVRKYGQERVSQIITYGKLLAKGVLRDVGRVLNFTYGEVDMIAKLVPEELKITLEDAVEKEPRLKELIEKDARIARLFDVARQLEGLSRHASVHAAGVVITNKPIVEHCPLWVGKEGESVVQFDMKYAEKIGLVKFDFLGLKTLTVIDNAVKFVRETQAEKGVPESERFKLDDIDYSDAKTYELISKGDTDGVFQLESSGMKDLCVRVQPSRLEDVTAINALYRPGPLNSGMVDDFINRKHGRTETVYEIPQLADILQETYGVIVYQEQVMRVARVLAGYSLGEADLLRRAMGKKMAEEMAAQREKFLKGCAKNQIPEKNAQHIFDLLAKFAEYGFNKSHSAAYAVLSFQTAYLKAYYPAQFMAALMATEMDDTDKMSHYIADAKNHGIAILPPDVNASRKTFSVVEDNNASAIRFGLEAIKGVGGVAVDSILAERVEHGPFKNFVDFCKRVPLRKVNKKVLECLITVGAFDSIAEENRATLFEATEPVIDYASSVQEQADLGQVSMFDQYQADGLKLETSTDHLFKHVEDWSDSRKLQLEKQLVGFYVSGHPMDKWWPVARGHVNGDLTWIKTEFERRRAAPRPQVKPGPGQYRVSDRAGWEVSTVALVGSMREIMTKKGSRMAFVDLEDATTKIEAICFPEAYEASSALLKQSTEQCLPMIIVGNISLEEDAPKIFIRSLELIENFQKRKISSVIFAVDPGQVNAHVLAQLRALLIRHRGRCQAVLEYSGSLGGTSFQSRHVLPKELAVTPTAELAAEVNALFGRDVVKFL